MKMEEMVIISVDDHITELGNVFDTQLSGEALKTAPKLKLKKTGSNYWEYQGKKIQSVAPNVVVGRVREEYGFEPTSLEQLRPGCYDVHARIDGGLFLGVPDKQQALVHLRAYNDWHIDERCGAYPGRFIPCGVLPLWD